MAQLSRQAFEGSVDQGVGSLLNPRSSYVGKLLLAALIGAAVTIGSAVAVGSQFGVRSRVAVAIGSAGALVVFVLLFVVYRTVVKPLRTLDQKAGQIVDGDYEVELATNRADEVGRLFYRVAQLRDDIDARSGDLESLNRRITRVVRSQVSVMDAAGAGDMTMRMNTDTGIPQFDALAEDFNEMMNETEVAIANSKQFSGAVGRAADEVSTNTQTMRNRIDDVTEATERIRQGVTEQDDRFAKTATEMSSLSATIQEVAASADELTDRSRETVRTTRRGREAAQDALTDLQTIRDQTDGAVDAVADLEAEMNQIDEVVDLIREIADETNLLAVNAQIEAAHAGGMGEGFGIVADKIKSLADDTTEAAEQIERSLSDLRVQTDETTGRIQDTRDTVASGTETIEDALGALDDIGTAVEETNASIQQINDATEEQATTAEDVVGTIDEVATIAERTAEMADDVAASVSRQRSEIGAVDDSVDDLAGQATGLTDSLEQFTVRESRAQNQQVAPSD